MTRIHCEDIDCINNEFGLCGLTETNMIYTENRLEHQEQADKMEQITLKLNRQEAEELIQVILLARCEGEEYTSTNALSKKLEKFVLEA